jgi:hypothetical protein
LEVVSGFEGGHGSHWDAVLEDPGELPRVVSAAFKRGVAGAGRPVNLEAGAAEARGRTLPLGDRGLEARLIELAFPGRGKPAVATVFPRLSAAGPPLAVAPRKVVEWGHDGLEAQVFASLTDADAEVAFFATDYLESRARYREGALIAVSLSAVAYTCGIISPAARFEEVGGHKVDVSRASIVAPLKDSEKAPYYGDDFFLQGAVTGCEPFTYPPWGEGATLRLDLEGLGSTPVFARKKDFPHGWPRAGEFVAAYAWLQGRVAETP